MTDAKRDNNSVTTLTAVSNVDGTTPVTLYADPTTHRLLVNQTSNMSNGAGAPSSTPSAIGQFYVDTSGKKFYVSTGTSSSADWTITN
jgi:hypothetical protein